MKNDIDVQEFAEWLPLIKAAVACMPDERWPHWHKYNDSDSVKYATKDPARIPEPCKLLIPLICLNAKTGCDSFPDLDLHGAGVHWIPENGRLNHHKDSQRHPAAGWYRRRSSVLFLSECSGGTLEVDGYGTIIPKPGVLVTFDSQLGHKVNPVTKGNRYTLSVFWWSLTGSGTSERAEFTKED